MISDEGLVVHTHLGYNQGEPGGAGNTDTGSNHPLPLEGKQMAKPHAIRSIDPILAALADPEKRASLARRMAVKVKTAGPSDCWPWTARASCSGGYGAINAGRGPRMRAHRVAWALAGNDLPAGQVLCHRCDNPKCCNPAHLFLGSQVDNIADMRAKGRGARPPAHRGEQHHLVTIPDADLPLIRLSAESNVALAARYRVSEMTIYRIRQGKTRTC